MGNLIMNCERKPIPTIDVEITNYTETPPIGICSATAKVRFINRTSESVTAPVILNVESSFLSAVAYLGQHVESTEGGPLSVTTVPTVPSRPWEEASGTGTGFLTIPPGESTVVLTAVQSSTGYTEGGSSFFVTCGDFENTVINTYMMANFNFVIGQKNYDCTVNFTATQSYSVGGEYK